MAAGVAALVLAVNPGLTPAALVSVLELEQTDDPPRYGSSFGWGRVNASRAVAAALQLGPP